MKPWTGHCLPLSAAALVWIWPVLAQARSMDIEPYPMADVWPATVRFLRVDRGFPIKEKDESAGYVLFEYTDGPKPCRASLELIRTVDVEGRDATRIAVSIPDLPRRYEQMLIDKLASKLREDQGPPAPAPKRNKPADPPKPDASPPAASPPSVQFVPIPGP
jgi:hypothetical protein